MIFGLIVDVSMRFQIVSALEIGIVLKFLRVFNLDLTSMDYHE